MDFSQILTRLKSLGGSLTLSQRLSLAGAFVLAVAIVGGSAYWLNRPDYVLLFADMDAEAASRIVERLRADKVPYELAAGGGTIRVPAARLDELRLQFASQGLPSSGRIGFEIFDRTAFGATEFLEQVNYRRALEGEIARTIGTLSEIATARVHIAMPKASLFAAREQPAKASVVLKLRSNRPLSAATTSAITNLVAASVEGLRPESVVVLDTAGRPLAWPAGDDDGQKGAAHMERQERVEKDLTAKVVSLLEPVVGAERVRVNVSARIDSRTEEQTEENWDPSNTVVRSRQISGDAATIAASQGVAGARANMPEAIPAAAGADSPATPAPVTAAKPPVSQLATRGTETTNYEISKTIRHTVRPRGDIARLSVAVILDHDPVVTRNPDGSVTRSSQPRTTEELQKIQALVAAAVGLDTDRGDQITVENVPFEEPLVETAPAPGLWQRVGPGVWEGGRVLGVLALGLLAFLFVVRPLVRNASALGAQTQAALVAATPQQVTRTVQDLEGEIEAQLDAAAAQIASGHRKLPVLTRRLSGLAHKEPEHAARLIRMWISEEDR